MIQQHNYNFIACIICTDSIIMRRPNGNVAMVVVMVLEPEWHNNKSIYRVTPFYMFEIRNSDSNFFFIHSHFFSNFNCFAALNFCVCFFSLCLSLVQIQFHLNTDSVSISFSECSRKLEGKVMQSTTFITFNLQQQQKTTATEIELSIMQHYVIMDRQKKNDFNFVCQNQFFRFSFDWSKMKF